MLKGLRSKTKKSSKIYVHYAIHVQEVKPWPPSESLKSIRSVVLHWENGDRSSGYTNQVAPSLGANSNSEGKIEFNESFKLLVSLHKDSSSKGNLYQKNLLELNLYEPRRDKTKGQHLGASSIDLAEHAILKEAVTLEVPINSKRSLKSNAQPMLYLSIQQVDDDELYSHREASPDKDGKGSVSALTSEDYAEDEIASFTDDDDEDRSSSHSISVENSSSSFHDSLLDHHFEGNAAAAAAELEHLRNKKSIKQEDASLPRENGKNIRSASPASSIRSPSPSSSSSIRQPSPTSNLRSPSPSSRIIGTPSLANEEKIAVLRGNNEKQQIMMEDEKSSAAVSESQQPQQSHGVGLGSDANDVGMSAVGVVQHPSFLKTGRKMSFAYDLSGASRKIFADRTYSTLTSDRTRNLNFPRRSLPDPTENGTSEEPVGGRTRGAAASQVKEATSSEGGGAEIKIADPASDELGETISSSSSPHKPIDVSTINRAGASTKKVRELERRIELLESELQEAAATEIGLYSIVAEHGSSSHKVHTPARRLSRFYLHAQTHWSKERKASVARSITSGLVSVAKACGNDVPRLTFWLSNSVVLRTLVSGAALRHDGARNKGSSSSEQKTPEPTAKTNSSTLKWEAVYRKKGKLLLAGGFYHWENPDTFMSALEKIESWIFFRIVESIWWQIFTPHMQSPPTNNEPKNTKKLYGRITIIGDQKQAYLSTEMWKKALKDSSEKLCPVRASGHECGCLPMMARLVMEQCVARLDVAMFNAVLRDPEVDIPTDPMSDPITDLKVLPIPSGKFSFGSGVQLKNAIGAWSRQLTDLFGMAMDDIPKSEDQKDGIAEADKTFLLLNALSDLLMLPKDMLLEKSVRKEVCPTMSSAIIRKILDSFATDEFCPQPVQLNVLEALESEEHLESSPVQGIRNVPCNASPIVYLPPAATLVEMITSGNADKLLLWGRSSSSVVRKSNTSDDELDELNAPLASILVTSSSSTSTINVKQNGSSRAHALRYQLLREVWKGGE